MPKISITGTDPEVEAIFDDPDYDQTQLQDYFRRKYGEFWTQAWRRYLETGDIS